MKDSTAPVLAGLVVGISFIVILSIVMSYARPVPPDMIILVDDKQYKAGMGGYGGRLPFGKGYGLDVDYRRTLPEVTISLTIGSKIQFSSTSFAKPTFSEGWVWIFNTESQSQYLLNKLDDTSFRIPSDVPQGDYVLSVRATYDNAPVSSAWYVHKIRIL